MTVHRRAARDGHDAATVLCRSRDVRASIRVLGGVEHDVARLAKPRNSITHRPARDAIHSARRDDVALLRAPQNGRAKDAVVLFGHRVDDVVVQGVNLGQRFADREAVDGMNGDRIRAWYPDGVFVDCEAHAVAGSAIAIALIQRWGVNAGCASRQLHGMNDDLGVTHGARRLSARKHQCATRVGMEIHIHRARRVSRAHAVDRDHLALRQQNPFATGVRDIAFHTRHVEGVSKIAARRENAGTSFARPRQLGVAPRRLARRVGAADIRRIGGERVGR